MCTGMVFASNSQHESYDLLHHIVGYICALQDSRAICKTCHSLLLNMKENKDHKAGYMAVTMLIAMYAVHRCAIQVPYMYP